MKTPMFVPALLLGAFAAGCGGGQKADVAIEVRELEEPRALAIVQEVLASRGYQAVREVETRLDNEVQFQVDLRVAGQGMAFEFLIGEDRLTLGRIPPAAQGSRLHVLAGRTVPTAEAPLSAETLYVFFLDDRKFAYHVNPTSETRADVTLREVEDRLRRDVADYVTWYETAKPPR